MTLKKWLEGNDELIWSKNILHRNVKPIWEVAINVIQDDPGWFKDVTDDGIAITYFWE